MGFKLNFFWVKIFEKLDTRIPAPNVRKVYLVLWRALPRTTKHQFVGNCILGRGPMSLDYHLLCYRSRIQSFYQVNIKPISVFQPANKMAPSQMMNVLRKFSKDQPKKSACPFCKKTLLFIYLFLPSEGLKWKNNIFWADHMENCMTFS